MADEQLIKPRELPAATTVFADDAIMTDNGAIVGKATPVQIVNAGAPVPTEAEAIAGTDNSKRMTPLTTKQVLDNVTAPSVLRAQAWAESDSPPNPGIPGSMSAKSWAAEAERLGAEQADRAEAAAAIALAARPFREPTVDALLVSERYTYAVPAPEGKVTVVAGDLIEITERQITMVVAPALSSLPYLSGTATGVLFYPVAETSPVMPEYWGGENIDASSGVNATRHMQKMSAFIKAGLGKGVTFWPGRSYIVHGEDAGPVSGQPYYRSWGNVIDLNGCPGVRVQFNDSTFKTADGLHYGAFDPTTGAVHNAPAGGFTNPQYAAVLGMTLNLQNSPGAKVEGKVEFDGNQESLEVGGYWGDVGIQLRHIGVQVYDCPFHSIEGDLYAHDYGLDGTYLAATGAGTRIEGVWRGVRSVRNGRQGLSWTGGFGMVFEDCEFNETGKGRILSAPGAGVDIEHNGQSAGDGTFLRCTMKDNSGVDFLHWRTESPGLVKFVECMIGSKDGSRALWMQPTGHIFERCTITSNVVNMPDGTLFEDCVFTQEYIDWDIVTNPILLDINSKAVFRRCLVKCFRPSGYSINVRGGASMHECDIEFWQTDPAPRNLLSTMSGAGDFIGIRMIEKFTFTDPANRAAIEAAGERNFYEGQNISGDFDITSTSDIIAQNARTGTVNSRQIKNSKGVPQQQVNHAYGKAVNLVASSVAGNYELPLGVSTEGEITTITRPSSVQARGVLIRFSFSSGADANHSGAWLLQNFSALGLASDPTFVRVGNEDRIRFAEGSVPLSGLQFYVSHVPLFANIGANATAPQS